MKIGYARVSTKDQKLDYQIDDLEKEGCEKIFEDSYTGTTLDRPGFKDAMSHLRKGDTFVVWKLDRIGRSTIDLIKIVTELKERGIDFVSIKDSIDTTTPHGKLFFVMNAAYAEYERDRTIERTKAGLKAARARGRVGGRPRVIADETFKMAYQLYQSNTETVTNICKSFGIKRRTFYKYKKEYESLQNNKETSQ